ncbi:MAG: diaminopimelate epimerase [Crocinitomicaceae bacterium]
MEISFSKYQGTGNDFVMLDNLSGQYDTLTLDQIRYLCDRKLGVGADGLIKISKDAKLDFNVEYFNSDGSQSFCGNGARCSVAFAKTLGCLEEHTRFNAIDGAHEARLTVDGRVHLEMLDVAGFEGGLRESRPAEEYGGLREPRSASGDLEISKTNTIEGNRGQRLSMPTDYIMDTGSPHYIRFIDAQDAPDIVEFGKEIRYSERFKEAGINVNTVIELGPGTIHVATYERGVEDETLSCGTGVTACALAYMDKNEKDGEVTVSTKGGKLSVKGKRKGAGFEQVWLIGPAKKVFDGSIEV